MKIIIRFLIFAVAVYLAAYFIPGIQVKGAMGAIIVTAVMALLNTFVKPLVKLLALPVTLLTLGLFALVINALFIMLCSYIVPDSFAVSGFGAAFIYSIVLSLVNWALSLIAGTK